MATDISQTTKGRKVPTDNISVVLEKMRRDLDQINKRCELLEEENKEIKQKLERLEEKCERLEGENKEIKEKCERLEEENKEIKQKLERIEKKLERLEEKCENLEEENKGIKQKLERIEEKLERIEEKCENLEEENKGIKQKFNRVDKENKEIKKEFNRLKAKFDDLEELKEEVKSLRKFNGEVILRQLIVDIRLKAANLRFGLNCENWQQFIDFITTHPDQNSVFLDLDNYIVSRGLNWSIYSDQLNTLNSTVHVHTQAQIDEAINSRYLSESLKRQITEAKKFLDSLV
jgi:DNA repair exonuclease SbcCD ATPase subunit